MASRLTCHNLKTGESEFGGVSVKVRCGKVRWNTVRQGDTWINGLFCEDEILTSNLDPSATSGQTAPESCTSEHSEVDWIAKEIAFQDLICNDRSSHWSDCYPGKELAKEEHEVDIISTLTGAAALFRDWCTDLPEPLMADHVDGLSNFKVDNQDEWIWISDPKLEVNKQLNTLTWSSHDCTWDDFIKRRLKRQHISLQAFAPRAKGLVYGRESCHEIWAEEELESSMNPIQQSRGTSEYQDASTEGQINKESFLVVNGELESGCSVKERISDQYVMLGSQSPVVSRYSFCDTTRLGETTHKGALVNDDIFTERLYSPEHTFDTTWFTSKAGDALPPFIAEEVEVGNLSFKEDLPVSGGEFGLVDLRKIQEGGSNGAALMQETPPVHEALPFALSYMGLQDLLMMERVCKYFRDWIRNDLLLWQQLHVEPPLSMSLTDEILLELAARSKGQLQCLKLVDCTRVTEMAVEQVVAVNPRLTKLCLPGCSKISADSVVRMVEMLTDQSPSLKQLRVRNIYGLTREHLASLERMVGARREPHQLASSSKPQYYHNGHQGSFHDDERPIDVEECPKCTNVRVVYDCTRERCQQKQGLFDCRACFLCTVRCEECGRCISDSDYEETFSLDLLCSCCWLRLPKCAECSRPAVGGMPTTS